ncbi:response regulator transcription factor [Campylobacter geochelonis]|uniref:response regulator transcription factor n=1 Tax=Campylobacter geochelonis TaxID=1780362 RepID=UPI000770B05B|nr:response regulator transcription factor [Campylobacter geochelonis]CZE48304.1 NAD(P)H-flavin oxidoreductase [Campylobacter geochelonis]CZE50070.1 NAD(P)H-flavin oxidoreductase [Campylobacter geochelonis]
MEKFKILKSKTILYAEDELGIQTQIAGILNLFFEKVIIVNNGKEAIDEFFKTHVDILMFDICMPRMNGLNAISQIRKIDKNIPVILVTAYDDKEYLKDAINLNVLRYIQKPFSKSQFLLILENLSSYFIQKNGTQKIKIAPNLIYDCVNKNILNGDEIRNLTKKEILAFEYLIQNRSKLVSFEELISVVYDFDNGSKETLKAIIKSLRKKIAPATIENRFASGYILNEYK